MEHQIECSICFNNMSPSDRVMYKTNNEWLQHDYCRNCLEILTSGMWRGYIDELKKADCEKALMNLLKNGMPTNITVNGAYDGIKIIELVCGDQQMNTLLKKDISDEKNSELRRDLTILYDKIKSDCCTDYLNEIRAIMSKYGL